MSNQKKDSTVFYKEWLPLINSLSDSNKLQLYSLIFSFDTEDLPKIKDPHLKSVFDYISAKIIKNNIKYKDSCDKARASANKRWKQVKDANACERIRTHYDKDNDNYNVKKDKKTKAKKAKAKKATTEMLKAEIEKKLIATLPPEINLGDWINFVKHRDDLNKQNSRNAKLTELAAKNIITELVKFEKNQTGSAKQALKNSVMNGWKGVFEPKTNKPTVTTDNFTKSMQASQNIINRHKRKTND